MGTYRSVPQKVRLLTENWAKDNLFCPNCGGMLEKYPNNQPVADLQCTSCTEDFELKSTSGKIRTVIPDGAYATMLKRLLSKTNPNLFLLEYDSIRWSVNNLFVIPKYYFTPDIVQKRTPLSQTARRAGWQGCNLAVGRIPNSGRIPLVIDRVTQPVSDVLAAWTKTKFLKDLPNDQAKSWLLKTMSCVDQLAKKRFKLREIYAFELQLRDTFPRNQHIREKLRQQLQVLRDRGYLRFLGQGLYELTSMPRQQVIDPV